MLPQSNQPFANRRQAGAELAAKRKRHAGRDDVVVLALPRGGIPVAFEVAEALDAELDIFLVRRLGMPGHREYAIGAIASGGVRVLSEDVVRAYRAATGCRAVIALDAGGRVSTVLRAEPPWAPTGLTVHGTDLYVAEWSNAHSEQHDYKPRVRKVAPDGTVTMIATLEK